MRIAKYGRGAKALVKRAKPWGANAVAPSLLVAAMPDQSIASRLADFPPDWGRRVAFSSIDGEIDFATLRAGMLGFAGWLAGHAGVERGSRVALCLPKSLEAVQVIYGIHAAGAAYAPLQFDGPPARLAAILEFARTSSSADNARDGGTARRRDGAGADAANPIHRNRPVRQRLEVSAGRDSSTRPAGSSQPRRSCGHRLHLRAQRASPRAS